MTYSVHCTSLLDISRQVLLDGKALVALIHNPQDDADEKVMVQVRKSIEISEKLAVVANNLDQEFNNHFSIAPTSVSEKFHLHEQIFLNSATTVQNSMVTLTRLTKSIISNIYMQTKISISQDKVDNCCKNLTQALKSMISAMEAIRKMADELASKSPPSPKINGMHSQGKDDDLPVLDHGVVLEAACKTVREWVQKLVTLVLQGDEGGDRSDLEYSKNFYEVGRATMNHMVKLINFAKKIGMLDEEARLKLLLFQLLSLAKSFNSNAQFSGALPEKQIQELNLVKVQVEESLWWFVKMAKLKCTYIASQEHPLDASTSHPILALPPKPLPPLPPSKASPSSSPSLSPSLSSSSFSSSSSSSSSSAPVYSAPTSLTRSSSNPPRFITPTSSAGKFERSVSQLITDEQEPIDSERNEHTAVGVRAPSQTATQEPVPAETKSRSSSKSEQEPPTAPDHKSVPQAEEIVILPDSPQLFIEEGAPNSPTTEARLKSVLHGAPTFSRSISLASVKAEETARASTAPSTPSTSSSSSSSSSLSSSSSSISSAPSSPLSTSAPDTHSILLTDDNKTRRKVLEIPPEVLRGIIPAGVESAKRRPVSQQITSTQTQKWVEQKPFDLKSVAERGKAFETGTITSPRKASFVQAKIADINQNSEKPPEIPAKPPGLKMSITAGQDRESAAANMTLRSGVLRRAHPQSVIFDTKKQQPSTLGAYMGDIDAQMLNFRAKITAHLDYILLDTYALNADEMLMLMAEKDGKVNAFWSTLQNPPTSEKKKKGDQMRKNPNIKIKPFDDLGQIFSKTELEASAELARRLEAIIHTTFDQYEGLRQINDFRSMPDVGQTILQVSNVTNTQLKKQLIAGSILIVCHFLQQVLSNKEIVKMYLPATKDEFLEMSRHEHNLKLATDNILLEYCKLKAGLLLQTGYVSSIVEQENGYNLNHAIVDKFLTEIYEITETCINSQVELFAKRAAEVEKIPKKRQKVIFAKFGGKEAFSHLATNTLNLLRPWMRKWVDVQVPSIVQRELFAKDIVALKLALEESKNIMVASFQELLNNQVPEPLYKFDAYLKSIDEELELASAIFGI